MSSYVISSGLARDVQSFLRNPTAADGIRLIYSCRTNGDYSNASVVFHALSERRRVNTSVVVAFMRTSRTCGQHEKVLDLWHSLPSLDAPYDVDIAINTLAACASIGSSTSLQVGKQVHTHYQANLEQIGPYLIGMYTKCGQHLHAIDLWKALSALQPQSRHAHVSANRYISPVICTNVLTSCAQLATPYALSQGIYIHSLVCSGVLQQDVQLATSLMNMYVKCSHPEKALEVWKDLEQSKKQITSHITCVCALAACANIGTPAALIIGKRVHSVASFNNWNHLPLFTALVTMYTKCGEPEIAMDIWKLWQQDKQKSIELCTAMLTTFAKMGPHALQDGLRMHSHVMESSTLNPDLQFYAALVNMYAKCGEPVTALSLWKTIQGQNGVYEYLPLLISVLGACASVGSEVALNVGRHVHSQVKASEVSVYGSTSAMVFYTALITMYTKCQLPEEAVAVYNEMLQKQIQPGPVTYTCLATACGALGPPYIGVGRRICDTIQRDSITDTSLENSLLSMLVKCGEPGEALDRWKSLCGNPSFKVSTVTYVCVLAAIADIGPSAIDKGSHIHSLLSGSELMQEDVMAALLNMYARCGQPLKALELWKLFISSYNGKGTHPSSPALYTALFTACATLRTDDALAVGSEAHIMIEKSLAFNPITNTAIIKMYSQCGDPSTALSLWTSHLRSHPLTGDGGKSDKIRIISALSVCSALRNSAALSRKAASKFCA